MDVELRRRFEVARTLMKENIERQRNADLQDDGQLLALIDLRLEEKRSHLNPDFDTKQLAELLGVSMDRLIKLFRNKSIYRTPEAYIDNLRTINAMRLLRIHKGYVNGISFATVHQDEIHLQTTHATHHDGGTDHDGRHCRCGVSHRERVHG